MRHLELSDIKFYVVPGPEEEWSMADMLRHEKITEHMMECEECCAKINLYEEELLWIKNSFAKQARLLGKENIIREQLQKATWYNNNTRAANIPAAALIRPPEMQTSFMKGEPEDVQEEKTSEDEDE